MQERYELCDLREVEVDDGEIIVSVYVDLYEREYQGSSRDEEYFEEVDMGSEMWEIECPIEYIYKDSDPDDVWEGRQATSFVAETNWNSREVVDYETVEFRVGGELYIATYDISELEEYMEGEF